MIIKLTVDRFEGDQAVLITEDNAQAIWPKNKLPAKANIGSVLIFAIDDDLNASKDSKQLAKNILNEILNTKENSAS